MGPEEDDDHHFNDLMDGEEDREDLEAELNCGQGADGFCQNAGTEYCEFECPFSD